MKFLKKVASASEAIQVDNDVLYSTSDAVIIKHAKPSITYSVKNISSPTVNWSETSTTITFTGVKTYEDGTTEETQQTQVVEFEQNTPQGDNPMDLSNINTEYVDLGLPSGLKWAKCNLGAQSETEAGAYFSWGDTNGYAKPTDKGGTSTARDITNKFLWNGVEVNYAVKQNGANGSGFSWATEKWNGGNSSYNSTYFESVSGDVCPNGVLANEYDAAYQATNGVAHMPTRGQINELTANTTVTWYAQGNTEFNGVAGRKFVSKTDPSKYIFIPAVGCCSNSSFYNVDSYGYVWSSSLNTSSPIDAYDFNFNSDNFGIHSHGRDYGFNVRGVLVQD